MQLPETQLPELMVGLYTTPEGHILARAPLGLTAYLDRPDQWAHGGAERILSVFLERMPRSYLRFLSTSVMPTWKGVDERSLPEVLESLRYAGMLRGIRHLFWMKLANDPGAPALGLSYTEIDRERSPRAGVLEITLPETWDPHALFELALEILNTAPVYSLVGGFTFRYDVHDEARAFNQIYRWADRYIAVDVQKPEDMAWLAPSALPGSSWLTYVGGSVAREAGIDLAALRAHSFQHDVRTMDVSDGLLFRAGELPMVGDINRMRFPFAYAEVARLLGPWFADPPPELWGTFFRQRHSALWFRRLIDPAAWAERRMEDEE